MMYRGGFFSCLLLPFKSTSQGLLVVVSAGNSGADACNQSPAASDFA